MMLPDISGFETDPTAGPVLEALGHERWRKARDAAKELCRKEKARYLPLLIAANVGLAKEMMNRGLAQDAAAVLDYLKTIAPPELLASLRARQAEGQATASLQKAAGVKPQEVALWRLAESAASALATAEAGVASPEALRAADTLVLASWALPEATTSFTAELKAVRVAVQATGDGRWEVAREALQGLPRHSLFQHWRFFLRGVRHVHLAENEQAQRCFEALPVGSCLERAARFYQDLLGLPHADLPAMDALATLPLLVALTGESVAWVAPLIEAQRHWQRGQLDKAYEALANPLRQRFPTDEPGLGGILTDVVLASCSGKSALPHQAQQDLVDQMLVRYHQGHFRSDQESLFTLRFFLHEDGRILDWETEEEYALALIKSWNRVRKPDPLRESAIWAMVAENLQPLTSAGTLSLPQNGALRGLRSLHERAAALDPENSVPAVRLALFHQSANDLKTYNKQLTDLAKRFPEARSVLILSAQESMRRKSWAKALTTLRKAHQSDPSDAIVLDLIVATLQEQILVIVKKPQPGVETLWQEMEPFLLALPTFPNQVSAGFSFGRTLWAASCLRSLTDPKSSEAAAAAARYSPGVWASCYLSRYLVHRYGLRLRRTSPSSVPTWQDLHWLILLMVWDQARNLETGNFAMDDTQIDCLSCLKSKASAAFAIEPEAMLAAVVCFARNYQKTKAESYFLWAEAFFLLSDMIAAAARKKSASYQIRLAAIILPRDPMLPLSYMADLLGILAEATAASDAPSAKLASDYLKLAQSTVPRPQAPDEGGESADDEDIWMDSDENDEDFDVELDETVRVIAAMIKLFPPKRLKEIEGSMKANGMPTATWRTAFRLAKPLSRSMTRKEAVNIVQEGKEESILIQPDLI